MKKLIFILLFLPFMVKAQTQIKIIENVKNIVDGVADTTYQLRYEFYIPIPPAFVSLPDKEATLQSFKALFPTIERIDGSNVVFRLNDKFNNSDSEQYIKGYMIMKRQLFENELNAIQVNEADWLTGQTFDGTNWICNE